MVLQKRNNIRRCMPRSFSDHEFTKRNLIKTLKRSPFISTSIGFLYCIKTNWHYSCEGDLLYDRSATHLRMNLVVSVTIQITCLLTLLFRAENFCVVVRVREWIFWPSRRGFSLAFEPTFFYIKPQTCLVFLAEQIVKFALSNKLKELKRRCRGCQWCSCSCSVFLPLSSEDCTTMRGR